MEEYLCLQTIKSSYIIYIGIIYTLTGIIFALCYNNIIDYFIPTHNHVIQEYNKNPNLAYSNKYIGKLIKSTIIDVIFIVFSAYIIRKIVKRLPFFLNGKCTFDKSIVKEINGGVILSASVITYYSVVDKLKVFKKIWDKNKVNLYLVLLMVLFIIIFIGNLGNIL